MLWLTVVDISFYAARNQEPKLPCLFSRRVTPSYAKMGPRMNPKAAAAKGKKEEVQAGKKAVAQNALDRAEDADWGKGAKGKVRHRLLALYCASPHRFRCNRRRTERERRRTQNPTIKPPPPPPRSHARTKPSDSSPSKKPALPRPKPLKSNSSKRPSPPSKRSPPSNQRSSKSPNTAHPELRTVSPSQRMIRFLTLYLFRRRTQPSTHCTSSTTVQTKPPSERKPPRSNSTPNVDSKPPSKRTKKRNSPSFAKNVPECDSSNITMLSTRISRSVYRFVDSQPRSSYIAEISRQPVQSSQHRLRFHQGRKGRCATSRSRRDRPATPLRLIPFPFFFAAFHSASHHLPSVSITFSFLDHTLYD